MKYEFVSKIWILNAALVPDITYTRHWENILKIVKYQMMFIKLNIF